VHVTAGGLHAHVAARFLHVHVAGRRLHVDGAVLAARFHVGGLRPDVELCAGRAGHPQPQVGTLERDPEAVPHTDFDDDFVALAALERLDACVLLQFAGRLQLDMRLVALDRLDLDPSRWDLEIETDRTGCGVGLGAHQTRK
jgi:hypothetical protein